MRILFIDDQPIRALGLIRAGHQVFLAHGFDQISVLLTGTYNKGDRYDLVCCDHDMPMMDGVDVVQEFLQERNIPVVIHSMNPDGADRMASLLEDGAVTYEIIPITTPGWMSLVEKFASGS